MKKYFLLLCCVAFIYGCKENVTTQYDSMQVEIEWGKNDQILLSDIVDSIAYIPLETTDKSLIGRIDKVVCSDDYVYILDAEVSTSIFVFDYSGRHISVINDIGKGPGEFMKITDFCCNNKGEVFVYDAGLNKVIRFGISGKFAGQEMKIDFYADFISYLDSTKTFLFYSCYREQEDRHNLIEANQEGKIINRFMQFDKAVNTDNTVMSPFNFSPINDSKISFFDTYSNNLYSYNGQQIYSDYQFDFGSSNLPADFLTKDANEIAFRDDNSAIPKEYVIFSNIQENKRHIFYTAIKGYGVGMGIYSKETGNNMVGFATYDPQNPAQYPLPIKNDVNNCSTFAFYGLHSNGFCSPVEISEIKSIQHIDPELKVLSENLSVEDNPVLMMFYLKTF
jgi:hypothetical protein